MFDDGEDSYDAGANDDDDDDQCVGSKHLTSK